MQANLRDKSQRQTICVFLGLRCMYFASYFDCSFNEFKRNTCMEQTLMSQFMLLPYYFQTISVSNENTSCSTMHYQKTSVMIPIDIRMQSHDVENDIKRFEQQLYSVEIYTLYALINQCIQCMHASIPSRTILTSRDSRRVSVKNFGLRHMAQQSRKRGFIGTTMLA